MLLEWGGSAREEPHARPEPGTWRSKIMRPTVSSESGITARKRAFTWIGANHFFAEFGLKMAGFSVLPSNPLNKSGYRWFLQRSVNFCLTNTAFSSRVLAL